MPRGLAQALRQRSAETSANNDFFMITKIRRIKRKDNGRVEAVSFVILDMRVLITTLALLLSCFSALAQQAPDYSAYILTPKAPDTPRINGPKVYGARAKADFLFRIPATGVRPMRFSAKGLPRGLKLDSEKGIISGKARRRGQPPGGDG